MKIKEKIEQLVTFRVGQEEFGVPITEVYEIIFVPQITTIPKSPNSIIGVFNLRGQIIPVIEMRIQFMMEKVNYSKKQRIIVARSQGRVVGLLVDEVTQVLQVDEANLEQAPDTLIHVHTAYIKAIYKMEVRLVVLLNLDQVLQRTELEFIRNEVKKL